MKFICILLKSNKKRVEHVHSHLSKIIPDLEIFNAIEGKTNQLEYYLGKREIKEKFYNFCRRGQLACLLSHVEVWKKIINENINECVILEDDALIQENFIEKFEEIYKVLPKDTDFLYLYVHPDSKKQIDETQLICEGYYTYGTVCYYITKKLAIELVLFFEKIIHYTLDESICWFLSTYNKNYYCITKNLVETSGNLYFQHNDEKCVLGSVIGETGEFKNTLPIPTFFIDEGDYIYYPACTIEDENSFFDSEASKEKYLNDSNVIGFSSNGWVINKFGGKLKINKEVGIYIKKNLKK